MGNVNLSTAGARKRLDEGATRRKQNRRESIDEKMKEK
jgi:hypothetical protein